MPSSYDPASLHQAIERGLVKQFVQQTKQPRARSRDEMVVDLVKWIATEKWTDEELKAIYMAARNRFRQKTCYSCGELKPDFGGEFIWPDGDMSKPKRFKCADCIGKL